MIDQPPVLPKMEIEFAPDDDISQTVSIFHVPRRPQSSQWVVSLLVFAVLTMVAVIVWETYYVLTNWRPL